jgi:hypothetical protein
MSSNFSDFNELLKFNESLPYDSISMDIWGHAHLCFRFLFAGWRAFYSGGEVVFGVPLLLVIVS